MEFLLLEASVVLYSAIVFSVNHTHICGSRAFWVVVGTDVSLVYRCLTHSYPHTSFLRMRNTVNLHQRCSR